MSQMGISIYELFQVTFNDYKRDYNGYLAEFLNDYEDNTELYFIKEQKAIVDSHLVKFKEVVMNLVEEDENKGEILDLFRNRINTTDRIKAFLEQRKQELEKPSGTVPEQLIAAESFQFKNNFDKVSENDVYQYFKKELVDKKYLNKEKLEDYLICAFQNNNAPKLKFTFEKITTKRAITQVFYNYYNTKAQKPYSKKKVYVELLTNYFNGYEFKNIDSNFSK